MKPGKRSAKATLSIGVLIFVLLGVSLLVTLPAIPNSYAHAFILKSEPADGATVGTVPSKVNVYFSDPIDVRYSKIAVLDGSGKQVDNKDVKNINGDESTLTVSLPSGLGNGVYTVSAKVLDATDGHVTTYAFTFGVGVKPAPGPQTGGQSSNAQFQLPETIVRFPALLGQVMVVGAALASLWLWRPIAKIGWLNQALLLARSKIDYQLAKLMVIGSIILIASGIAMIIVQANSIGAGITDAIFTKFGNVWIIRMVQCGILLAISVGLYNKMKKSPSGGQLLPRTEVLALLMIGIAILATTTLISHGASTGQALPVALDFIHNVVASIWIGGVIYLAFVMIPAFKASIKANPGQTDYAVASALTIVIPRFSVVVLGLLGAILITGPFLLYSLEPSLDLTLSSLYGKALISKLILAGGMAAVGGYNQRIIHRQAQASVIAISANGRTVEQKNAGDNPGKRFPTGGSSGIDPKSPLSKFGRSTKIETGLGIGLLVAVAVLVNTGTPASEFQGVNTQPQTQATPINNQTFTEARFVDNGRVLLSIDPFVPGNNNFTVTFVDQNRNPIDVKSAQLKYTQVEQNIGPITVDAKPVSKGVFSANAAFGIGGHWNLRVEGVPAAQNATSIVANYNDLIVRPKPAQLNINIQQFKLTENQSQPLYPIADASRNSIWVGDTKLASGQLWQFDINSSKFIVHRLDGVNIITLSAIDSANRIWYIDPLSVNLGVFDPSTGKNQLFKVPVNNTLTGLAIDQQHGIVWLSSALANQIIPFDIKSHSFGQHLSLPALGSYPFILTVDKSGVLWALDPNLGALAEIDTAGNFTINEYSPPADTPLHAPTAMFIDPDNGNIYISEHEGHAISVFNPLLHAFTKKYALNPDPASLPFGMAMDSNHFLWVAQHTLNKILVLDPRTGEYNQADIPIGATNTQWITSDSQGNVWLAEQTGYALGVVTTTTGPLSKAPSSQSTNQTSSAGIFHLGLSYGEVAGPGIAIGLVATAFLYAKSAMNLNQSIRQAIRNGKHPG